MTRQVDAANYAPEVRTAEYVGRRFGKVYTEADVRAGAAPHSGAGIPGIRVTGVRAPGADFGGTSLQSAPQTDY